MRFDYFLSVANLAVIVPSKEERILFWQYSYARASFIDARLQCELLLSTDPPPNSQLRRALSVAIVTLYARPFKQRKAIRLSEDIVPAEFRKTHDDLIELRDKLIAHRDLDAPEADWGFVSQVRVDVRAGEIVTHTVSPFLKNGKARDLLPLLDDLTAQTAAGAFEFVAKYLIPLHPSDGSYVVSLDKSPSQWLTSRTG